MPRKKDDSTKVICVYVPPELHQSIKLVATFDGMTMEDWIIESLLNTLRQRSELTLPITTTNKEGASEQKHQTNGHPPQQPHYRIKQTQKHQKHQKHLKGKTGIIASELPRGHIRVELNGAGEAILPRAYLETID